MDIIQILFQIMMIYLLADLIGGVFHWAEDTLGDVDTPIWGPIFVRPNTVHHEKPADMMKIHWVLNNAPNVLVSLAILLIIWRFGLLSWQWVLFGIFGGINQQVHRFAHAPRQKLPTIVTILQKLHLIQDARHHWEHHKKPHTTRYCVLTPWMNPVLDRFGFWRAVERLLVPVFGAPRREDLADRPWYRP